MSVAQGPVPSSAASQTVKSEHLTHEGPILGPSLNSGPSSGPACPAVSANATTGKSVVTTPILRAPVPVMTPQSQSATNSQGLASLPQSLSGTAAGGTVPQVQQGATLQAARAQTIVNQVQMFNRSGMPQQGPRTPIQNQLPSTFSSQGKQDFTPLGSASVQRTDGQSKESIDEAENERTRLENRERKKRWREANEDRNKDNDLRCRVNKRAHKLYGKEPSKAKEMWIEEEFNKRKSKRQEKEGKGPDGNLLIEGTDLSSLNHYEMNNVIMATLSEFATNPSAPALRDNADLNAMLQKLRTDPASIKALLIGQPKMDNVASLTSDNMNKMNGGVPASSLHQSSDDEEDEDNASNQESAANESVIDLRPPTGARSGNVPRVQNTGTPVQPLQVPRRFSTSSNGNDIQSQHQTYGIGNGFEPQVALSLSSELFRLICMRPTARPGQSTVSSVPSTRIEQTRSEAPKALVGNLKQEVEAS